MYNLFDVSLTLRTEAAWTRPFLIVRRFPLLLIISRRFFSSDLLLRPLYFHPKPWSKLNFFVFANRLVYIEGKR